MLMQIETITLTAIVVQPTPINNIYEPGFCFYSITCCACLPPKAGRTLVQKSFGQQNLRLRTKKNHNYKSGSQSAANSSRLYLQYKCATQPRPGSAVSVWSINSATLLNKHCMPVGISYKEGFYFFVVFCVQLNYLFRYKLVAFFLQRAI